MKKKSQFLQLVSLDTFLYHQSTKKSLVVLASPVPWDKTATHSTELLSAVTKLSCICPTPHFILPSIIRPNFSDKGDE